MDLDHRGTSRLRACIVLCGLPASGKSTLAASLVQAIDTQGWLAPAVVVDVDRIRGARYEALGIDRAFEPAEEASVRAARLDAIGAALDAGTSVIDDDMNYYRSMRREVAETCTRRGVHYAIVHVTTPHGTCTRWNASRGEPVPRDVIASVKAKFDVPGGRRSAWDAPLVAVNPARAGGPGATRQVMDALVAASLVLPSKLAMHGMLQAVESVTGNPAFWNIALVGDIVNKGFLVNNVQEWKDRISSKGASVLESFDLVARQAVNEAVAASGPLSPGTLAAVSAFKQEARATLKRDPARLAALLDGLRRVLNESG